MVGTLTWSTTGASYGAIPAPSVHSHYGPSGGFWGATPTPQQKQKMLMMWFAWKKKQAQKQAAQAALQQSQWPQKPVQQQFEFSPGFPFPAKTPSAQAPVISAEEVGSMPADVVTETIPVPARSGLTLSWPVLIIGGVAAVAAFFLFRR